MDSVIAPPAGGGPKATKTIALTLGSIGVVYGDIGTSPLYAMRESLKASAEHASPAPENIIGTVSLLLWLLTIIATLKYVLLILRADNKGEGGTLSLLALCLRVLGDRKTLVLILGITGISLFFGDSIITPALSVLSAVEGIVLVVPSFHPFIIPVTVAILLALFWAQSRGTARISIVFSPIMVLWFLLLAGLGLWHLGDDPRIFQALSPLPGLTFLVTHGEDALPVLGSVILAITGAEALYADMGHFGRRPIRLAWFFFVFPALALSYLGQGAMVLARPETANDPFFLMAPDWGLPFLVGMATLATIIASQAVITGAFSAARQAIQLGLLPRMDVFHTSASQQGQIYVPRINMFLLVSVLILVFTFKDSTSLTTAYGIAVTGEMIITTLLAFIVMRLYWNWGTVTVFAVLLPFLIVEFCLFTANLTKFFEGGYLPIGVAALLVTVMWTWVRGGRVVREKSAALSTEMGPLARSLAKSEKLARIPGTAVFLTAEPHNAPPALLHNLKHNSVLHARNYIVSVSTENRPYVAPEDMAQIEVIDENFTRVRLSFGYMDEPNVPVALRSKVKFDIMATSFFLNQRTFRFGDGTELSGWQKRLYVAISKTAAYAPDFYRLPSNRVVVLGQQITL